MEETRLAAHDRRQQRVEALRGQPAVVQDILREHIESQQHTEGLTLRKLSPGVKATIWLLRLYVLFMAVVVVINVVQTVHP